MNSAQGVVKQITSRPAGKGVAYNVTMDNGDRYGHGFKQPSFKEGDFIKFLWTANGNFKNIDHGSVEVSENTATVHNSTPAKAVAGGGISRDDYWARKEERDLTTQKAIQYQAARNVAVEFTKVAIEAGALKLPAKQADQLGVLEDFVFKKTQDFNTEINREVYGIKEDKAQDTGFEE